MDSHLSVVFVASFWSGAEHAYRHDVDLAVVYQPPWGRGVDQPVGFAAWREHYARYRDYADGVAGLAETWLVFAGFILLIALPLVVWLTRFEPQASEHATSHLQAGRGAVLRDPRFYAVMPLYIAPAFLLTGMFFSHTALIAERGWSLQILAQAFSLYAGCKIISSLISGRIVDAVTARRFQPFAAIPLVLAFVVLAMPSIFTDDRSLYLYLALCGINLGMAAPISGGLWPEMYGTAHLGAIRSMTGPIIILSTSIAPVLFGAALELGLSFSALAQIAIIYMLGAMTAAFWAGYLMPVAVLKE